MCDYLSPPCSCYYPFTLGAVISLYVSPYLLSTLNLFLNRFCKCIVTKGGLNPHITYMLASWHPQKRLECQTTILLEFEIANVIVTRVQSWILKENWFIIPLAMGFPGGAVVKNLPASARDSRELGLIPGLGRSPGDGSSNPPHNSILAWKIPRTEEPGGLQSRVSQRVQHDCVHTHTPKHNSYSP